MIKRMIFLIVSLFLNHFSMGQRIEFNERGLNILRIDERVEDLKGISFDKMEKHSEIKSGYVGGFPNEFLYYYIKSDTMFIEKGGLVKDIFFATDKYDRVRGIFLVIENLSDSCTFYLDKAYGAPLSQSHSSIRNIATSAKTFRKKNEVNVFLIQYPEEIYSKVMIYNSRLDEKSPGVDIRFIYE
ncbi:MAG: hypothetical protein ABIP79_01945 [Chitinophagaceae bacterium]